MTSQNPLGQWQLPGADKPPGGGPKPVVFIGIVAAVMAAVILMMVVLLQSVDTSRVWGEPIPAGDSATKVPELTGTPFVSVSPEAPPPKLRDVKPVSVVGPTWQKGEKTYTFAFRGIPFAFRGGEHWGCLAGTWENEDGTEIDGHGWRCINERGGKDRPQVDLLIRQCDGECDQREQRELDTDWLDRKVDYQRRDPTTQYAEGSKKGKYTLVVSHFFAAKPGGKLNWQVAVECESRPADKTELQKVVNDIRTQSG